MEFCTKVGKKALAYVMCVAIVSCMSCCLCSAQEDDDGGKEFKYFLTIEDFQRAAAMENWYFDLIGYKELELKEAIDRCYDYIANLTKYEKYIPQDNVCKDIFKKIGKYNKLVIKGGYDSKPDTEI